MIDLHIHTNYSDGYDSLIDVLKIAEEKKLEYISITDHDNCKAYKELKNINVKKYYSGIIIPGIEIKCAYEGRLIEVLGYNIDTDKMNAWADNFYKDKSRTILQQKYFNLLYDKCLKMNLILTPKEKMLFDSSKEWASLAIYNDIKSHKENQKLVPEDFWESFDSFSKKYCGNKEHILFIDKAPDYPSIEEAIDAIKNSDGLLFLPHIYIYKWASDIPQLIEELLGKYKVDGIECYHSEFNDDNIEYLRKLCCSRGYYMSGGSDYHGKNKKGVEIAIGKGNLNIEKDIIANWINKKNK